MTEPVEVTVLGVDYWARQPGQLLALLTGPSVAPAIADPTGAPPHEDGMAVVVCPALWRDYPAEFAEALAPPAPIPPSGGTASSGALAPMEQRLTVTVEEAATLLGISRAFAYEAVARGEIPSIRIGRRVLVPRAALERLVASVPDQDVRSAGAD